MGEREDVGGGSEYGSGKHSFALLRNLHIGNGSGDFDNAVNRAGGEIEFRGGVGEGFFGESVEMTVLENGFCGEIGVCGEGGVFVPRALARAGKSNLREKRHCEGVF